MLSKKHLFFSLFALAPISASAETISTATGYIQGSGSPITYEIKGNKAIYQGDIVLGDHHDIQARGIPLLYLKQSLPKLAASTQADQNLDSVDGAVSRLFSAYSGHQAWTDGIVPYTLSADIKKDKAKSDMIKSAMSGIEKAANIRFVERTDQNNYLAITKQDGCWSEVGMQGGKQELSLGEDSTGTCYVNGIIQHEMLHALGFWHEQSRPDRDKYVRINWDNIAKEQRHNFQKEEIMPSYSGSYDYNSIMHYESDAFSINGKPTITPINAYGMPTSTPIGQREGLSIGDKTALIKVYGAPASHY